MTSRAYFRRLRIHDWRQFAKVDLDLDSQVVVLTGVNGSGKTTILRILGNFIGEPASFLATPQISDETGKFEWFSGFSKSFFSDLFRVKETDASRNIGDVEIVGGGRSSLSVPVRAGGPQVGMSIDNPQVIAGAYVPSHRPVYFYEQLGNLSIKRTTKTDAYRQYLKVIKKEQRAGQPSEGISSKIKSTLLNWGYVGYGSKVAPADVELIRNYEGFEEVLRRIFQSELKFLRYEIRSGSEVVFLTEDGEFLFETASGGISALIHLAWMIYTFTEDRPATILIDEIENHLHPALQRIVLPNLMAAFPNTRFVVTTHSPLVVTSVRDARVYALHHDDGGKIIQSELDFTRSAQTASAVLDKVLGVPVTMPIWAEEAYERIVEKYVAMEVADIDLKAFRDELRSNGLEAFVLDGVESVLQQK